MARAPSPSPAPASPPLLERIPAWWIWPVFVAAVWLAYLPAMNGALLWDDGGHLTRSDLRSLHGLYRIWFEVGATQQYYPVLHTAFWLEQWVWGRSPLGYHLLNVVLHATAACQFGVLLRRLRVPGGWFAAALFALHPVCVESVAWISEQKNTLSAVFYLAAALTWLRFDAERTGRTYGLATGLFILALLTKTVTATLPAALLVLCWWRQGRIDWRRDVLPLLPWFALGAGAGLFTAHFERVLIGANGEAFALSFLDRLVLSGRIFWFYLGSLAWPSDLIFIYSRWTVDASIAGQWLWLLAGLGLLGALIGWSRRQRGPLAAGLLFAGTLFPVLGFFNVYPFVFSYVADHFQYLASLAIFALVGAGWHRASQAWPTAARSGLVILVLPVLAVLSWAQCRMYRDPVTLYETTLRQNPNAWMAHNNLAIILGDQGRLNEAVSHLETSARLKPDHAPTLNNLGYNLLRLDRPADALPVLDRAVRLRPDYGVAHRNRGLVLATMDRTAEALASFETACRLSPEDDEAELNRAIALMLLNRFPEAVSHFEQAIALAPGSAENLYTYGRALAHQGRPTDAMSRLEAALALNPNHAEAHYELAMVQRRLGRIPEATRHYRSALELNPALAHAP